MDVPTEKKKKKKKEKKKEERKKKEKSEIYIETILAATESTKKSESPLFQT